MTTTSPRVVPASAFVRSSNSHRRSRSRRARTPPVKKGGYALTFAVALAVLLGVVARVGRNDSVSHAARPAIDIVDFRGHVSASGTYPEVQVSVLDNEFDPAAIRISPGTTVSWVNKGRVQHDIHLARANANAPNFGVEAAHFSPGEEYEFHFDKPGVYRYYC